MIGIIAASEDELKPIIDALEITCIYNKALLTFHIGQYKNIEIVAVYSGVCKVNAAIVAQVLIDSYNIKKIYVTGVAGALDDELQVGDTVILNKVAHHDVEAGILTEYHPFMKSIWYDLSKYYIKENIHKSVKIASMITGEAFITIEHKSQLIKNFNVHCVDMESAAFAQVCYANKIPIIIFKTITDNTDEDGHDNFENNVIHCSQNCAHYVLDYIEKNEHHF